MVNNFTDIITNNYLSAQIIEHTWKKTTTYGVVNLAWDSHKNVTGFNQLMGPTSDHWISYSNTYKQTMICQVVFDVAKNWL